MVAVAILTGVLGELRALHEAGLWHGTVDAEHVEVAADGSIRLRPAPIRPNPDLRESALRAADVAAAGRLLCELLRIPPATSARRATRIAETELGRFAVRLATARPRRRAAAHPAAEAHVGLWEAAGGLAGNRRQAEARRRLGLLVEAELAPLAEEAPFAATPALSATAAAPAPSRPRRWPGYALLSGVAVTLAALVATLALSAQPRPVSPVAARPFAPPAPVATSGVEGTDLAVPPSPLIAPLPLSGGDVRAVLLEPAAGCAPGRPCQVTVEVQLAPSAAARNVAWQLQAIDPCSGRTTVVGRNAVTAQPHWTRVAGSSTITLPASATALRVMTESPVLAGSPLLQLGTGC